MWRPVSSCVAPKCKVPSLKCRPCPRRRRRRKLYETLLLAADDNCPPAAFRPLARRRWKTTCGPLVLSPWLRFRFGLLQGHISDVLLHLLRKQLDFISRSLDLQPKERTNHSEELVWRTRRLVPAVQSHRPMSMNHLALLILSVPFAWQLRRRSRESTNSRTNSGRDQSPAGRLASWPASIESRAKLGAHCNRKGSRGVASSSSRVCQAIDLVCSRPSAPFSRFHSAARAPSFRPALLQRARRQCGQRQTNLARQICVPCHSS